MCAPVQRPDYKCSLISTKIKEQVQYTPHEILRGHAICLSLIFCENFRILTVKSVLKHFKGTIPNAKIKNIKIQLH